MSGQRPRIDKTLLMDDIQALAEIGRTPEGGVTRIAYSPADLAGRDWVEERMRKYGMSVRRDGAGNTIGRLPGKRSDLPAIGIGSHTDTVPNGGHYDGTLGVIAGLSVVDALVRQQMRLDHPLELINFAAEEGALAGGTFGSRAMAGLPIAHSLEDRSFDGEAVREHIRLSGLDPDRVVDARREVGELAAFVELHIEQSDELVESGKEIGIVIAIAGIRRYAATLSGQADHAGTAAMRKRRDALVAASELVLLVRELGVRHDIKATVGTLRVVNGAPNVVPGVVEVSIEARAQDDILLDAFEQDFLAFSSSSAEALIARTARKAPVPSAINLVESLEKVCAEASLSYRRLSSGAGHDAGCMARLAQHVMIFVPSRDGLSHCPREYTLPEQCVGGAQVLLDLVLSIDANGAAK